MCGILGYIFNDSSGLTKIKFEDALTLMEHRGPDGFGVFDDDKVMLGHRRLSIIDLSESASQPFTSSDGKVVIVFNGEIYNFKEISGDLKLKTSSDTEVLLEGYLKYGTAFFKKIRGIYAFALYDYRNEKKCILYRDPAGIKPLYFYKYEDEIIFASELKSILYLLPRKVTINENVLKQYIHLGYCPEPETIYSGISALPPGQLMEFDISSGEYKEETLFKYEFSTKNNVSEQESTEQTRQLLEIACKRNLVSDVEVSIALSGGIDSSLIFALSNTDATNKIKGITIGFDEKQYDESEVASAYADFVQAPHIIEKVEIENKLEFLNKLLLHFDQPYADSSFIPFYFLCNKASSYSKVLIGGDSGDEIHNGYSGYRFLPVLFKLSHSPLKKLIAGSIDVISLILPDEKKRMLKKFKNLMISKNFEQLIFNWESWFPTSVESYPVNPFKYDPAEIRLDFEDSGSTHINIEKKYFYGRMMSDYLRKSDMMSMLNSIEFRVPMLDEDLVKYSFKIPYKHKSDLKKQKKILRKIHSEIYPSQFSNLKKKGFTIPLDTWLGDANIEIIRNTVMKRNSFISNYITEEYMDILFKSIGNNNNEAYISRASAYQRVLILYSMELWYDNNSHFIQAQTA